jgi:hypothetical protein
MPRLTHTRPRSRCLLLRLYIFSNGTVELLSEYFLLLMSPT